jgi:superfamily I DNA and/or RNA helicase
MFGIANRLAYDGGMVLARGKAAEEDELTRLRPLLGESRWFDVAAQGGGPKHFIPEQAEIVLRLVRAYAERGLVGEDGLPALFVVSPFRSMADGVRKRLCDDLQARGHAAKAVGAWGTASVGTVHTFQGKEKETVILALGGTSDGAIAWACSMPNILNVAVTRAQRRLYVVGDRARWMAASSLLGEFAVLQLETIDVVAEGVVARDTVRQGA